MAKAGGHLLPGGGDGFAGRHAFARPGALVNVVLIEFWLIRR